MKLIKLTLSGPERPRGAKEFVICAECTFIHDDGTYTTSSAVQVFNEITEVDSATDLAVEKAKARSLRADFTSTSNLQAGDDNIYTEVTKVVDLSLEMYKKAGSTTDILETPAGPKALSQLQKVCVEAGLDYQKFLDQELTQGQAVVLIKVVEGRLPKSRA